MAKNLRRADRCLNCGEAIQTNFCPHCGQENTDNRVSVRALFQDVIDEFLKFDSKLFATLSALILRPGLLTKAYNTGRRVRFIPPFKLYFTITAVYFLVFSSLHTGDMLRREMDDRAASVDFRASVQKLPTTMTNGQVTDRQARAIRMEGKFRTATARLGVWLTTNLGTLFFFLVPVTALFLKLLYLRSDYLYVEHLVFAVHNQCFQFLVSLVLLFAPNNIGRTTLAMLIMPVYTVFAMRRVYEQGMVKSVVKSLALTASFFVMMGVIGIIVLFYFLAGT